MKQMCFESRLIIALFHTDLECIVFFVKVAYVLYRTTMLPDISKNVCGALMIRHDYAHFSQQWYYWLPDDKTYFELYSIKINDVNTRAK